MLTNASPLASQRLLPWRQVLVYRLFRPIKEQQGTEVLRVQACHRCLWSTYTFSPDRCRRYQGGRQHLTSTSRIDLSPRGSSPLFPSSQAYITTIITRVNSYTCFFSSLLRLLPSGSTNLLFVLGYIHASAWPSAAWTTTIINYIRKYDSNHLIIDGPFSSPFEAVLPGVLTLLISRRNWRYDHLTRSTFFEAH
jgi:hypothetical protein